MESKPKDKSKEETDKGLGTVPKDKPGEGSKVPVEPLATKSTELGISSSGQSGVLPSQQMLLNLTKKHFDLEEVWNIQEVYAILGDHGLQRVMERAEAKFDKWRRKQGFKFSEISQERARRGFLLYTLLDTCVASVNDLFLITGADRAYYRSYAERVMKGLTQNAPSGWLRVAYMRLKEWSQREEIMEGMDAIGNGPKGKGPNKDLLKVLTWITLKAYAFYCKQMMR
jgi:hypothetical protein